MPRATKPKKSTVKKTPKKKKNKGGRPTKMSKETIAKLEHAFALGCSDLEACFYADISKPTLYLYQEKHPEFTDRKELLKERPVLEARQSVIKHARTDGNLALKYLERKRKGEFSLRSEYVGGDGKELEMPSLVIYRPKQLTDDYDGNKSTTNNN